MDCPICGKAYEGDVCPNCGRASGTPESGAPRESHVGLYVVLGVTGGIMLAATVGFLMTSVFFEKRTLVTPEKTTRPEAAYRSDSDETAKQERGVYESGDYEVGTEIPAGTYIILSDGAGYGDFYTGVYDSPGMEDESKIYGGWSMNSCYVIVEEGQYLHFSHATLYDPELVDIELNPFKESGMFLVGRDLKPGTYTVVSDNDQYAGHYEVYSALTSSGPVSRTFRFVGMDGVEEVTLSEGEYIQTEFCILKK